MGFDATGEVKGVGGEFDGVGVEDIADVAEDVVGPQGRGNAQGGGIQYQTVCIESHVIDNKISLSTAIVISVPTIV
jgi:hypothetical protein